MVSLRKERFKSIFVWLLLYFSCFKILQVTLNLNLITHFIFLYHISSLKIYDLLAKYIFIVFRWSHDKHQLFIVTQQEGALLQNVGGV